MPSLLAHSAHSPGGTNDSERLKARYYEAGIATVVVEVAELIEVGGGIRCMTAFLRREEV